MLANRTVLWSAGTAALCLLLLAAGWFILIDPRRTDAAALSDEALSADSQAAQLQVQIAQLRSQAADLPTQKVKLEEITKQLTPDAGIPAFVRELQTIAAETGVELTSITPGSPALQTVQAGGAATDGTTTTTTPATGTAAAGSLVSVPMNLSLSGDYFQTSQFLKLLQTKVVRSYLVSGLTVSKEEKTIDTAGTGTVDSGTSLGISALSGAALADGAPATTGATATGKGTEGATATSGATATATATSGATVTTAPAVTATTTSSSAVTETVTTLAVTGSIYVLLDGSTTLEEIEKQVAAATAGGTTATPGATATPSTAATSTPTATN